MKKYIKYFFTLILLLIFTVFNKVSASSYSTGYVIDKYDIDMVVNENNTFEITEKITVNFTVPKHGIFRKIPLKNNVTRVDGTKSNNRAKISNISVSENYTTYKKGGYEVIKIGDSNQTYTGRRSYTIKYTYNIGKDPLKDVDELYFNLIGDEWDTNINNVSFKITMPKSFDKSLLGFSYGSRGSTESSGVYYNVDGNVISGSLHDNLYERQGLTVRLTLPEGYFVGASLNIDIYSVFVIIFSIVCLVVAYVVWTKYGKDNKVIETVEFYPPEGYNSAEVGFLYYGKAENKSVISLLIYLANKGYLKIEENKKGFRIKKIKDYDGDNECEKLFFNGLFKKKRSRAYLDIDKAKEIMELAKANGEEISFKEAMNMSLSPSGNSTKTSVTESDLYDEFYVTLNKIKSKLDSKKNLDKIFEKSTKGKAKWLIVMAIAIFLLITIKPVVEYGESLTMIPIVLIFPLWGIWSMCSIFSGSMSTDSLSEKIFLGLIFGLVFGLIPWIGVVGSCLIQYSMYILMGIIGIASIAVIIIFIEIMPKRTPYGNEILGKLRGFKRFLETAEKPQLESLVSQNPEYFYDILPYTYALGVSDVWISQFESIAMQAPDWYDSKSEFSTHTFGNFIDKTMSSASKSMSTSYSSSSGSGSSSGSSGGSSGGGSSGGGSGGGGGGSW